MLYVDYVYAATGGVALHHALASLNPTLSAPQNSMTNQWNMLVSSASTPVNAVSGPVPILLTNSATGAGWPGIVPLYGGLCVDQFNNLYGSSGSLVIRLGDDWSVRDLFEEYAQGITNSITPPNLPSFGTKLFTSAQNLNGAVFIFDRARAIWFESVILRRRCPSFPFGGARTW